MNYSVKYRFAKCDAWQFREFEEYGDAVEEKDYLIELGYEATVEPI